MARVKINGISIDLPYEPYESQIQAMEKILKCMMEHTTGMIESPTGTGKSLSIICAALAYREHINRNSVPTDIPAKKTTSGEIEISETNVSTPINDFRIIICSRTHKQLDQLVQQLNKTRYKPRISILASRNQYCIHPKLQNVSDKNTACSELVKQGACNFFNGKDRLTKRMGAKIFDIEEIVREGKKCGGCPYYASRKLLEDADLIFAPYNYLLDRNIRSNTDIDLNNSIIIIDEAHNIDDVCRSSGSIELTSKIIDIVVNELLNAVKSASFLGDIKKDFMNLLEFFRKLILNAEKMTTFDKINKNTKSIIRKGKAIKAELIKIGITCEFMILVKNALSAIFQVEEGKDLLNLSTWHVIETLDSIISPLLFSDCAVYSYVFTKIEKDFQGRSSFSYNFWLLDGAYVFAPFVKQVRSLVILSGTLSPFVSFSSELGHKFAHELVAPHLITEKQVSISCLKKGHLKQDLLGTYKIAESLTYLDQVAKIVYDMTLKVEGHGGTLVFVPSYSFLDNLHGRIKLLKLENLFCEPKAGSSSEFESVLKKYHARITAKKPVVLICVYRGKASEGVDFKDSSARAVICVGIPYPSLVDMKIELKKEYNDKYKHFNGRRWYETQAFRAVNQAAGRAIRHKDDWGIILMLDSRYQDKRISSQLSGWVSEFMRVHNDYDSCLKGINTFLKDKK
ncbi:RAD3-like DNA-binding helicase [Vairimorpha necatrix]|uniref:DNA 5'-3' helicase n=1 Tax=Vairimorpha necatrix TaxID=6039 RepID=A0AAX4JGC9_9MICR